MAKYRLREQHVYSTGEVLAPGTVVGDDTPYPWDMEPSPQMEGLDDEGKKRVNEIYQKLYGRDAEWDKLSNDMTPSEDDKSEPVSEQQARERGQPPEPSRPTAPARSSAGPATPKVEPAKEQSPKG